MSYQMSFNLTDQEYAALNAAASRAGKPVEEVLHAALASFISASPSDLSGKTSAMTPTEFTQQLYQAGIIMNVASREKMSPEEDALLEELARLFAGGKSAADMVIEDRGPL